MVWFLNALHRNAIKIEIVDLDEMKCKIPGFLKGKLVKDQYKDDVCGKGILKMREIGS